MHQRRASGGHRSYPVQISDLRAGPLFKSRELCGQESTGSRFSFPFCAENGAAAKLSFCSGPFFVALSGRKGAYRMFFPPIPSDVYHAASTFRSRTRSRMSIDPSPFTSAAASSKIPSMGRATRYLRITNRSREFTEPSRFRSPGEAGGA